MSRGLPSFIPGGAEWYVADCVEANRVGRHSPLAINTEDARAQARADEEAR